MSDDALGRNRYLTRRAGDFDRAAVEDAAADIVAAPLPKTASGRQKAVPKGFPTGDVRRWVPIGPSVVRRGQANGRPRVSGRIRALSVSSDGQRAYAASAMGGLWYSDDGASTWAPVGGWADRAARSGGANNAQACGALLVTFGATSADDLVLVGTGEMTPWNVAAGEGAWGGLGVLAGKGPASKPIGDNPWESETGVALLEGVGVSRLVRDPTSVAGVTAAAGLDRVLAATSSGLFLGIRTAVAAPPPAHDEYRWVKLPGIDLLVFPPGPPPPPPLPPPPPTPAIGDVLWMPRGANGRIVVTIRHRGVAFSDDLGLSFTWLAGANRPVSAVPILGLASLANPAGTSRVYVLTAVPPPAGPPPQPTDVPTLLRVPDMTPALPAVPAAVPVLGVPPALWGAQRDYDQAIAVDALVGGDRIFLGGSFFDLGQADLGASLWCLDLPAAAPLTLASATGVSRVGAPAPPAPPPPPAGAGDGADRPGHIGNNVHADVHAIVLTGGPPGSTTRQVWVGCDGGVYVSERGGRVNTFASRATGLGALQPGYVANHPTSSHFAAVGVQDNGTQVRSGDSVWEEIFVADGGGVLFHPQRSHLVIGQNTTANWQCAPPGQFRSPTGRFVGGGVTANDREADQGVTEFYSGPSAVPRSATESRIAVGTNRVWITDNLGAGAANSWSVLPFPSGGLTDPRAGGSDQPALQLVGVPLGGALGPPTPMAAPFAGSFTGPLGTVVTVKWANPTTLIALFQQGVVSWVEAPAGGWTATVLLTMAAFSPGTILTDLSVVPSSTDFYVTTTGDATVPAFDTCLLFDAATATLVPTGLRAVMAPPPPPAGLLGPLDPAYSVSVDPLPPHDVYVGTVTAVWRGERKAGNVLTWGPKPFVNGLPQAAVQDLSIWVDPVGGAGATRLMRAAVQSRGVWEVDLTAATEPVRTYVRVHARDDRRRFPTPMQNPRRAPAAAPERVFESPDIVVRPRPEPAAARAPKWLFGAGTISALNAPTYQVWTFQTAFRWLYPSVVPDGAWSDAFGDLVEQHRADLRLPAGQFIDRALWNAVVLGTRLTAAGLVSANAADPLAVYSPSWRRIGTSAAATGAATEIDLMETVRPRSQTGGVWGVFSEPSTVDVLLHHRDSRPVPMGQAFAMLLWRSGPSGAAMLASTAAEVVTFAMTEALGNPQTLPTGWNLATPVAGVSLQRSSVDLDARLPRAVSIDVDLSAVRPNHRVLFLAVVGSSLDPCASLPVALPPNATVSDLVQRWPYAALRLAQVSPRP